MIATEQQIETFIDEHGICIGEFGIATEPHRCTNTSKFWGGNCFETKLTKEGIESYECLYTYAGVAVYEQTLASALWFLVEEAEYAYGGWETYEAWNHEHGGYYEKELGREAAEGYYEYGKEAYQKLTKILGQELYEKLSQIVVGG